MENDIATGLISLRAQDAAHIYVIEETLMCLLPILRTSLPEAQIAALKTALVNSYQTLSQRHAATWTAAQDHVVSTITNVMLSKLEPPVA